MGTAAKHFTVNDLLLSSKCTSRTMEFCKYFSLTKLSKNKDLLQIEIYPNLKGIGTVSLPANIKRLFPF